MQFLVIGVSLNYQVYILKLLTILVVKEIIPSSRTKCSLLFRR